MLKNYNNIKLERFKAGGKLRSEITAKKLNDMIDAIESIALKSGVGYLLNRTPLGTTLTINGVGTRGSSAKLPFSLYIRDSDDEFAYVSVRPALVNSIIPEMLNAYVESTEGEEVGGDTEVETADTYTSIEDSPVPMLQVSATERVEILLRIIIERESTNDSFTISQCVITADEAEEDSELKITHIVKLGYVENGVATSYHSTSLNAEICEETLTVWAA